jgi:hypothetical protein
MIPQISIHPQIDVQRATEVFDSFNIFRPIQNTFKRKQTPHRIRWKGQFIQLRSGKTVWPSLNAAKVAVTDKLGYREKSILKSALYPFCPSDPLDKNYIDASDFYRMTIQELQNAGILEFVPVKENP